MNFKRKITRPKVSKDAINLRKTGLKLIDNLSQLITQVIWQIKSMMTQVDWQFKFDNLSSPEGGSRTIRKTELEENSGILKNPLYTLHKGPKRHNICRENICCDSVVTGT